MCPLTRYDPLLADKISQVEHRETTPVALMNKVGDSDLPHLNPKTMKYAMLPGGRKGNIFVSSAPNVTDLRPTGFQSTGKGALHSNVRCKQQCSTCGTASPALYHARDTELLKAAQVEINKSGAVTQLLAAARRQPPAELRLARHLRV